MEEFLTLDEDKLDYASRLSGLLLNEGTDVLRWFLLDNLPRTLNAQPDLNQRLKEKKEEFREIITDELESQKLYFPHEMFDILYPADGFEIDVSNMEISLLYLLIRFMCHIKHPTWLWWDEDPRPHQQAPVFDVIRLVRFKERMKDIVHSYDITTEIYEKSFNHVTQIIDRLRGYKMSSRRWKSDDVIAYSEDERLTKDKKPLTLLSIMRWQTLTVKERNETYLVLKENFEKFEAGRGSWDIFISHFGQMQNLEVCEVNCVDNTEDETRDLLYPANDPTNRNYLTTLDDKAKALNWKFVMDVIWKKSLPGNFKVRVASRKNSGIRQKHQAKLTPQERAIYKSIDDTVFINDHSDASELFTKIRSMWKRNAIEQFSNIAVFPYEESDLIAMDDVKFNARSSLAKFDCWTDALTVSEQSLNQALRIHVVGPPSIGKTTFLHKISRKCATNDCPQLSTYDVVFYVDLAIIQPEKPYVRMVDCIKRQLSDHEQDISADDIEYAINSRKGLGILLLLDNMDELSSSDEFYEVWDIIRGNLWPQCGIITTSKPALFKTEEKENNLVAFKETYRICFIEGFNNIDVRNEVHRYFNRAARAFSEGVHNIPTSIEQALTLILDRWLSTTDITLSGFGQAALESLVQRENLRYAYEYSDDLQKLSSIGVIKKPYDDEILGLHFTHPLLKDYLCASVFCESQNANKLHLWVCTTKDALRLQHFLIFCCKNKNLTEIILDILSKLLVTECHDDDKEKLMTLCMRCFLKFYNDSSDWRDAHCKLSNTLDRMYNENPSADDRSDLICATLHLTAPHKLSHVARESILTFVTACKPGLTQSGTIFPLLRTIGDGHQTSCIRELSISDIRPKVANFVALMVAQLPFLSSLSLKDIVVESAEEFKVIRNGLIPSSPKILSALHDLEISFRCETRFELIKVPQYDIIAPVFRKLTFLEKFNIQPLTYSKFISLFDEDETIVPIERVDLSNHEVSEEDCHTLSKLLSRSIFLRFLNLSHNPIYGGLGCFLEVFASFRILQVLQLEECCLTTESIAALAASFKATNVMSSLRVLELTGNHIDNQASLLELASSMGNLRQLRKLNMSRNFLGDRVICVLASQLLMTRNLQDLKLNYVQMGKLGFNALRSNVCLLENLQTLNIGENPLPPDALTIISDWMASTCKLTDTIKDLTISGLSADLPLHVTKNGARKSASSIGKLRQLRTLNMIHTAMANADVMIMMAAVDKHPTMERIALTESLTSFSEAERKAWSRLLLV